MQTRRRFLNRLVSAGGLAAIPGLLPAWAQSARAPESPKLEALSGTTLDLEIARTPMTIESGRAEASLTSPFKRSRSSESAPA